MQLGNFKVGQYREVTFAKTGSTVVHWNLSKIGHLEDTCLW